MRLTVEISMSLVAPLPYTCTIQITGTESFQDDIFYDDNARGIASTIYVTKRNDIEGKMRGVYNIIALSFSAVISLDSLVR